MANPPTTGNKNGVAANRRPLRAWAQYVIVLLPFFLTLWFVLRFSVDVPRNDQWIWVPYIGDMAAGRLSWHDVDIQHTESRILLPQAAYLLLASQTGYNVVAENVLSLLFNLLICVLLLLFFAGLRRDYDIGVLWFLPLSLLIFGWRQCESLLWGAHLLNTMGLFFLLLALYCSLRALRSPLWLGFAILSGLCATFSYSSGLAIWPLCFLFFVLAWPQLPAGDAVRFRYLAIWAAASLLAFALFFSDYQPHLVPWDTGPQVPLNNPFLALHYALTYLGSPLAQNQFQAHQIGWLIVLFSGLLGIAFVFNPDVRTKLLPLVMLQLLVWATVPMLLSRRLALGLPQAFETRYTTLTTVLPVALFLCHLALGRSLPVFRVSSLCLFALLCYGIYNSYSYGMERGPIESKQLSEGREALRCFHRVPDGRLVYLFPNPAWLRERADILERYRLGVFREPQSCPIPFPASP